MSKPPVPPPTYPVPEPGRYRHYKGNEYEVDGLVVHSETLEWLVLYRPLSSPDVQWVRPAAMFLESVELPEGPVPRFARLD